MYRWHFEVCVRADGLLAEHFLCCECLPGQTMKYTAVDAGHLVCDIGAESTEFYVVMSGKFAVKVHPPGNRDTLVRVWVSRARAREWVCALSLRVFQVQLPMRVRGKCRHDG